MNELTWGVGGTTLEDLRGALLMASIACSHDAEKVRAMAAVQRAGDLEDVRRVSRAAEERDR